MSFFVSYQKPINWFGIVVLFQSQFNIKSMGYTVIRNYSIHNGAVIHQCTLVARACCAQETNYMDLTVCLLLITAAVCRTQFIIALKL